MGYFHLGCVFIKLGIRDYYVAKAGFELEIFLSFLVLGLQGYFIRPSFYLESGLL